MCVLTLATQGSGVTPGDPYTTYEEVVRRGEVFALWCVIRVQWTVCAPLCVSVSKLLRRGLREVLVEVRSTFPRTTG